MKTRHFVFALLAAFSLTACKGELTEKDKAKQTVKIAALEQEIATSPGAPPAGKLEEVMEEYERYAKAFPDHANASVTYLFKAAETARQLGKFDRALKTYDWITKEYAGNPKAANALFMKGYTFDNDLHQLDSAKVMFQSFLMRYPKHEFADDAQFLLDNMGKSDEEIIQQFEAKKKEQEGKPDSSQQK